MVRHTRSTLVLLLILFSMTSLEAQDISERQQVAVFHLSYYGHPEPPPPPEVRVEVWGRRTTVTIELRGTGEREFDRLFDRAFRLLDNEIQSVFYDLGRFDIIPVEKRLTSRDVRDFVDMLSQYAAPSQELPEAVLLGRETFTEQDLQQIGGGYVIVVPSVTWYDISRDRDGFYQAEMETSFSFIRVDDMRVFEEFTIVTTGSSDNPTRAVEEAVNGLPAELSFQVRSMDAFAIRTAITETSGQEVVMEFGSNMGILPGEEYAVMSSRVLSDGSIASTPTGLIVISDVQYDSSTGHLLYSDPPAQPGDQLQEVPRRGAEVTVYGQMVTDFTSFSSVVGIRGVASRGFYGLRPLASLEIPIRGYVAQTDTFPFTLHLGGEWNTYMGRLRISPAATFGLATIVPLTEGSSDDSLYLAHLGGQLRVQASYLITRDIYLDLDVGGSYWFGIYSGNLGVFQDLLSDYWGLTVGLGVTLK